jgi:L-ribulokinase
MKKDLFVIGADFGTDSVRAMIVDASTGREIATAVTKYRRWNDGLYCNPSLNQFRQHPLDYLESVETAIKQCVKQAGGNIAANIKAISVDTTGSTPVAVDQSGTPLSLLSGFEDNPNAMFVLWKDHTAVKEAAEINEAASRFDTNYLQFVGGIYSSEWFWAKLLHVLRHDAAVRSNCYSWVEHCDWIPFHLTGGNNINEMKRSVCAAGHKALWSPQFNGLPPDDFFSSIDPLLSGFRSRLFQQTYTADQPAGRISKEWSQRLGISENIIIGTGAFDAHMGAVGAQIAPYYLCKVMGTSTCDMLVAPEDEMHGKLVKGICGRVNGSVVPGMIGMEAGQSSFGDSYAWFRDLLSWPLQNLLTSALTDQSMARSLYEAIQNNLLSELSRQASEIVPTESDELAIDWFNGRRTPDADQSVKASIHGLSLSSSPPKIYRAIVEGTCFGARAIRDRFIDEGVPVKGLMGIGGIAKKSPFIMQMMADVMNMPISIHKSEQTCALGAAMFAATAAGIYEKVEDAMSAMGRGFEKEYYPNSQLKNLYDKRYHQYLILGKQQNKHQGIATKKINEQETVSQHL